jgi:CRP/FNR family transcriptional regulator, cyclic AMP receptor protein
VSSIVALSVNAWIVPSLIFLIVIVACLLGLRWIRSEHVETLRSIPLFSGLSTRQLDGILRSTHGVGFEPGARIVTEGDTGTGFFIMTKGTASVIIDARKVATLGPGSYFGEMAVLDGGPRIATIQAMTSTFTLELPPSSLSRILRHDPSVVRAMEVELCDRLAQSGDPVEPTGDGDPRTLRELSQRLRRLRHPDWVETPGPKRWLAFSRAFARGDSG